MIVVTGANGQLGFELKRILREKAIYLTRNDFDLETPDLFEGVLRDLRPTYLINAAAYTAVDKAETELEKANLINAKAPARLAELSRKLSFKMIHVSTDYVFNGRSCYPLTENTDIDPQNAYGKSKAAGELEILKGNSDALILRTSWLYSSHGHNFVKTVLRMGKERKNMNVVADQIGSLTWAADLAGAIVTAKDEKGIFHFSNEGVCSWFDVASAIKHLTKLEIDINPISTSQYPTPARRPAFSLLSKEKFKDCFAIKIPHWMESLEKCLNELS